MLPGHVRRRQIIVLLHKTTLFASGALCGAAVPCGKSVRGRPNVSVVFHKKTARGPKKLKNVVDS